MKRFCCVTAVALLLGTPVLGKQAAAQQLNGVNNGTPTSSYGANFANSYGNGGGTTNIWSSAQGTSYTYGNASASGISSSGSMASAGGQGGLGSVGAASTGGGGTTSAFTTSNAMTSSFNGGYAQAQTSGYAGGSVSGWGGRGH
jgi:hypothetical protein